MSAAPWLVPRVLGSTASRLFGRSRTISGVASRGSPWFAKGFTHNRLVLPPWRDLSWSRKYFRESRRLVGPGRLADRHVWERIRIPAYGIGSLSTDLVRVPGPDWRDVEFYQEGAPVGDFRLAFARPRNTGYYRAYGAPYPEYELIATRSPNYWRGSGEGRPPIPPESNRRRQDNKLENFYNRSRAALNKYYGRPSEWMDFLTAVYAGGGFLLPTLSNLSFNEAVDRAYGARARYLRENVYKKHWYNVPVGLTTLSRLFPW